MIRRVTLAALAAMLVVPGLAQNRNAFLEVDATSDISTDQSNAGLTYFAELGAAPTFTFEGTEYVVTDLFGFYVLSNDGDFVADHDDIGIWKARLNNGGVGGVAGWHVQPGEANGLQPGGSFTFNFNSLNVEQIDRYGYHVRFDGFIEGNDTVYITGIDHAPPPVPEAGTIMVLGAAVTGVVARRFKKK